VTLHPHAAGARRAPAALLFAIAALLGASEARAHDPGLVLRKPAAPSPDAPAAAAASVASRSLRQLSASATAVVLGDVTRTEPYDEDRLRLHRLHVARVLRGRLDDVEPGIVEIRGGTTRPPVLTAGERVVVFLQPAPRYSYLSEHLPAGPYQQLVADREGVVPIGTEADVQIVERVLAGGGGSAAMRRLAFTELGSSNGRLVADAVLELRALSQLGSLSTDEAAALGAALTPGRADAYTRVQLIELIGERRVGGALPVLAAAEPDTPAVLTALLAARARLGGPPTNAEIARYLNGKDPALRAAALRALAARADPAALGELERYATTDPDLAVRGAAIEALGATKEPAAVPVLARTFAADEPSLRQKSARALLAIGGPSVDDALVNLALRGDSRETQTFAALTLLLTYGPDHPAVRRVESGNPSLDVRKLLEQRLEFRHPHQHDHPHEHD
jgi:HEAT repeat protein